MTATSPPRVLDPFTTVATEGTSCDEAMASMGAGADPGIFASPRAPSPPPSSTASDLVSREPQAEGALWSAPDVAASSPPTEGGLVSSELAKVLASLGYNEMASAAALLHNETLVSVWQEAITVFAAPDVLLQAACPGCSRRELLLRHMALGYFPYAELATARSMKLLSASGFCLNVSAERGPFAVDGVEISRPELFDNGRYVVHGLRGFVPRLSRESCIEGTHHRLGARSPGSAVVRMAMARLRERGFGFVALAIRVKCTEPEKLANLTVFALDDQAIFNGGRHGYVSAVRFHIVPGHRLTRADLLLLRPGTVLATLAGEDQKLVITHGAGADEVQINYVPVKEADLVINSRIAVHGIYIPFPRPSPAYAVAVASATPLNGICGEEAISYCTSTSMTSGPVQPAKGSASEVATAPPANKPAAMVRPLHPNHGDPLHVSEKLGGAGVGAQPVGGGHGAAAAAAAAGAIGVVAIAVGLLKKEKKRRQHRERLSKMFRRRAEELEPRVDPSICTDCGYDKHAWTASCCGFSFCSLCVVNGYLDSHVHIYRRKGSDKLGFCGKEGLLIPTKEPEYDPINAEFFFTGEEKADGPHMKVKTFVNLAQLRARQLPKRLLVWYKTSDDTRLNALVRSPVKKNLSLY
ncbi:hypothetical protein PAHAL_4G323000 [Panicum hallii]|uniref:FAS1 domain-containing protein n=1 Tax=Panicum hallii TaxID=206008 RepID=A0A2T8JER3_9POAL|nr:hypothetical protein PAHAL_4G323000 [Panicum hallii]